MSLTKQEQEAETAKVDTSDPGKVSFNLHIWWDLASLVTSQATRDQFAGDTGATASAGTQDKSGAQLLVQAKTKGNNKDREDAWVSRTKSSVKSSENFRQQPANTTGTWGAVFGFKYDITINVDANGSRDGGDLDTIAKETEAGNNVQLRVRVQGTNVADPTFTELWCRDFGPGFWKLQSHSQRVVDELLSKIRAHHQDYNVLMHSHNLNGLLVNETSFALLAAKFPSLHSYLGCVLNEATMHRLVNSDYAKDQLRPSLLAMMADSFRRHVPGHYVGFFSCQLLLFTMSDVSLQHIAERQKHVGMRCLLRMIMACKSSERKHPENVRIAGKALDFHLGQRSWGEEMAEIHSRIQRHIYKPRPVANAMSTPKDDTSSTSLATTLRILDVDEDELDSIYSSDTLPPRNALEHLFKSTRTSTFGFDECVVKGCTNVPRKSSSRGFRSRFVMHESTSHNIL